jgi:hypothetical protein
MSSKQLGLKFPVSIIAIALLITPGAARASTIGVQASSSGGCGISNFSPPYSAATCSYSGTNYFGMPVQAFASVSLGAGTLEVSTLNGTSGVQLWDTLSFTLPNGYSGPPIPVTLSLTVAGSVSGNATLGDGLSFGGTEVTGCIASGTFRCYGTVGLNLSITEYLTSSATDIPIWATLSAQTAGGGGSADDPPYLSLILPDDVTFSSGSGVFLSAVATPVPAALPLFSTGLGAMGLFGWRRKRKNIAAIAAA